jgi:hypothetical protein
MIFFAKSFLVSSLSTHFFLHTLAQAYPNWLNYSLILKFSVVDIVLEDRKRDMKVSLRLTSASFFIIVIPFTAIVLGMKNSRVMRRALVSCRRAGLLIRQLTFLTRL